MLSYKVKVICFRNRPKISHIFVVAWISWFRKTRWKCHSCGPVILAVTAHSAVDNLDTCLRIAIYAIICEHLSEYRFPRWKVQGILHPRNPIWLVSFTEGIFAISLDQDIFLIAKLAFITLLGSKYEGRWFGGEQMTTSQCTANHVQSFNVEVWVPI